MDYITQINRAIDYIELNLTDDLVIEDIAKEVGYLWSLVSSVRIGKKKWSRFIHTH